jgi:hypothetical protein
MLTNDGGCTCEIKSTFATQCSTFQRAMATETTLSELSAGSCPTSSTPPLPSTRHLQKMRFLCSSLYNTAHALCMPDKKRYGHTLIICSTRCNNGCTNAQCLSCVSFKHRVYETRYLSVTKSIPSNRSK